MEQGIWKYKGPYNSCDWRDLFTDEEKAKHAFAIENGYWEELTEAECLDEQLRWSREMWKIAVRLNALFGEDC